MGKAGDSQAIRRSNAGGVSGVSGVGFSGVMVVVIVAMMVPVAAARIGSGLWVEGGLNCFDVAAEAFDHFTDDVVGPDADPIAQKLHGQMAVAEVPGDAD